MEIHILNNDVLLMVGFNVPDKDKLKLPQVCKWWKQLFDNKEFWKKLVIQSYPFMKFLAINNKEFDDWKLWFIGKTTIIDQDKQYLMNYSQNLFGKSSEISDKSAYDSLRIIYKQHLINEKPQLKPESFSKDVNEIISNNGELVFLEQATLHLTRLYTFENRSQSIFYKDRDYVHYKFSSWIPSLNHSKLILVVFDERFMQKYAMENIEDVYSMIIKIPQQQELLRIKLPILSCRLPEFKDASEPTTVFLNQICSKEILFGKDWKPVLKNDNYKTILEDLIKIEIILKIFGYNYTLYQILLEIKKELLP